MMKKMRQRVLFSAVLTLSILTLPVLGQEEGQQATDFVIGLNAFNRQIIQALDQQSSNRVMVLPFTNRDGSKGSLPSYISEQLVTALAATKDFQVIDNSSLVRLVRENNISPMAFNTSEVFLRDIGFFASTNIVVGTVTNLGTRIAVMGRIIQGDTGNYGGAGIVYLRKSDETAALSAADGIPSEAEETRSGSERTADTTREEDREVTTLDVVEEEETPEDTTDAEAAVGESSADGDQEAAEESTSPRPQTAATDGAGLQRLDETALYRYAKNKYDSREFTESIRAFDVLLTRYPDSPLADNAAYWIGESYYSQGRWSEALAGFQRVLTDYPYGNKVPAAMLKAGYCQEKLGNTGAATATLRSVVSRFAESREADLARNRIQIIRALQQN